MKYTWTIVAIIIIVVAGYLLLNQPSVEVPIEDQDPQEDIDIEMAEHNDLIRVMSPYVGEAVSSPLTISGEARGQWYFEATFPVILANWDGLIIAEGYAEAQDSWMTEEYVPFESVIEFESPYSEGDPEFMRRGTLILQKANASGLPEHDDALEFQVYFAPTGE